ncbi:pali-domain-containing protein [Roridomyces roridus]|uniref:Pali-domain-containing protein n=1 Tax=Roridomyces roridus TaxID=1738132 RepID=A0AAD7C0W3_9AGAR|nr:pali-domain-containing protein [Roridomyces roridus]
MSQTFYRAGMVMLFCALVLSFLSSISLPYLPAIDVVRAVGNVGPNEVRWGIWGVCQYDLSGKRECTHTGHAYEFALVGPDGFEIVGASWTRGLAIHPVATGAIAIAFGFAFSKHQSGTLISSLVSFVSAAILIIAFAIDIALFAEVHHVVGKLDGVSAKVHAGTAFWMTMVSIVLVLLAGFTVCLGRRKENGNTQSYPMMSKQDGGFFARFRR